MTVATLQRTSRANARSEIVPFNRSSSGVPSLRSGAAAQAQARSQIMPFTRSPNAVAPLANSPSSPQALPIPAPRIQEPLSKPLPTRSTISPTPVRVPSLSAPIGSGVGGSLARLAGTAAQIRADQIADQRVRNANPQDYGKAGPNFNKYAGDRQRQASKDFFKGLGDLANRVKDAASRALSGNPHLDPKKFNPPGDPTYLPDKSYGEPGQVYQLNPVASYKVKSTGAAAGTSSIAPFAIAPFSGIFTSSNSTGILYQIRYTSAAFSTYGQQITETFGSEATDSSIAVSGVTLNVFPQGGAPMPQPDQAPGTAAGFQPGDSVILDPGSLPDFGILPGLRPVPKPQRQPQPQKQTDPTKSPFPETYPDLKPSPFPAPSPLPSLPDLPMPDQAVPGLNPTPARRRAPGVAPIKNPASNPETEIDKITQPAPALDQPTPDRCKDPCIQLIVDGQDDCCDEKTITIKKFKSCFTVNELGESIKQVDFELSDITVLSSFAEAYQTLYDRIFAIESLQCEPCNAIAAIPEWWAVRTGADRPQGVLVYANLVNGKRGTSRWSLTIPHYNPVFNYSGLQFPTYTKGSHFATLTLPDNSKLTVNADSQPSAEMVISQLIPFINPDRLPSSNVGFDIHTGRRKGQPLAVVEVVPVALHYFATGQRNMMPTWVIDL